MMKNIYFYFYLQYYLHEHVILSETFMYFNLSSHVIIYEDPQVILR